MDKKKGVCASNREVVQRYCPQLKDNVVMLRTVGAEEDVFECLNFHTCKCREAGICDNLPHVPK